MRLFVSEYVCGGAWCEPDRPESLTREGRAMLTAVVSDAAQIPGVDVVATWDGGLDLPPIPGARLQLVGSPLEEADCFSKLAASSDRTIVIAPEFNGILEQRSAQIVSLGGTLLGSSPAAIHLTADKLALARYLHSRGLLTIDTAVVQSDADFEPACGYPVVIKPRDGAGSQETWLLRSRGDWFRWRTQVSAAVLANVIVQPYVAGRPLSVAVNIHGTESEAWPVCEQTLSDDGRFTYLGGVVPAREINPHPLRAAALAACAAVPGLRGYVGVDLIQPSEGPPVIVEINPRFTTSYLGYRELTEENLVARLLFPEYCDQDVLWRSRPVMFDASGSRIFE